LNSVTVAVISIVVVGTISPGHVTNCAWATVVIPATAAKAKPSHPPYSEMIAAAIATLHERGGSSRIAIKKYVQANYKLNKDAFARSFRMALSKGVETGLFLQSKQSYRLNATDARKYAKKTGTTGKAKTKKATTTAKSPAKKKTTTTKAKSPAKRKSTSKSPAKRKSTSKSPAKKKTTTAAKKKSTTTKKKTMTKKKTTTKKRTSTKSKSPAKKRSSSTKKKSS